MVELATVTTLPLQLRKSLESLTGETRRSLLEHELIAFDQDTVHISGQLSFNDETVYATYEQPANYIYGAFRTSYYVIASNGVVPLQIVCWLRTLILGIDFFQVGHRWLYFRDDPRVIFPDSRILVRYGYRDDVSTLWTFLHRHNAAENQDILAAYLRQWQTPKYFRLALNAVAGQCIVRKGGRLQAIQRPDETTWVYVFDNEIVKVSYAHTELEVATYYAPLTIIGDAIQVLVPSADQAAWWRQVDWSGGLSLDPFINVKGLHLRDDVVWAYPASEEVTAIAGTKLHTRLRLGDSFDVESVYWAQVAVREKVTGRYLNDYLGLSTSDPDEFEALLARFETANAWNAWRGLPKETPDVASLEGVRQVNALDIYFETAIGAKGLIVYIDSTKLTPQQMVKAYHFLRSDMLTGCTPVVFVKGYDGFDEAVEIGKSLLVTEAIVVQDIEPTAVEEQAFLEMVSETIVVSHELPVDQDA